MHERSETPYDFLAMAQEHLTKAQAAAVLGDPEAAQAHLDAQIARLTQAIEAALKEPEQLR